MTKSIQKEPLFSEICENSNSIPIFDRIDHPCMSVERTVRSKQNNSVTEAPTVLSSYAHPSESKKERPNNRPSLCWAVGKAEVNVLIMTTFDGQNPMRKSTNGQLIIGSDVLLHNLGSIHPTSTVLGRQVIKNLRSLFMTVLHRHSLFKSSFGASGSTETFVGDLEDGHYVLLRKAILKSTLKFSFSCFLRGWGCRSTVVSFRHIDHSFDLWELENFVNRKWIVVAETYDHSTTT